MKPTNGERREVAENLRNLTIGRSIQYKEQFFDELAEVVVGFEDYHDFYVVLEKLADLIDPTAHERTVADNLALIDRNRELECELKACKAKLGRVFKIAARLRGDARMAVLRAEDAPVPRYVADRFEIAEEIAEALR